MECTVLHETAHYDIITVAEDNAFFNPEEGLLEQYALRNKNTGLLEYRAVSYPGVLGAAIQAERGIRQFLDGLRELNKENDRQLTLAFPPPDAVSH